MFTDFYPTPQGKKYIYIKNSWKPINYHDIKKVGKHCVKDETKGAKFYEMLLYAYLCILGL